RFIEGNGERNRGLYVLKARGTAHSNQVREFLLTDHGIELLDVYTGPSGVLTGTARRAQEARERAESVLRQGEVERKKRELARKRDLIAAQIAALRAELDAEEEEAQKIRAEGRERDAAARLEREEMTRLRKGDIKKDRASGSELVEEGEAG